MIRHVIGKNGLYQAMNYWEDFVKNVVVPFYNYELLIYQKVPTWRVQYPGGTCVEPHIDYNFGHPAACINWWFPVTMVLPTNGIIVDNHRTAHMEPGEVLIFDGGKTPHWNDVSKEKTTRVSFDARFIFAKHYSKSLQVGKTAVNTGERLELGYYYELST